MWCCEADYADGTHVERKVPYNEGGNYLRENERQMSLSAGSLATIRTPFGGRWSTSKNDVETALRGCPAGIASRR